MTRVLVVDDEPQILRALRINLRVRDYEVHVASWLSTWPPSGSCGRLRCRLASTRLTSTRLTEPGMGYRYQPDPESG